MFMFLVGAFNGIVTGLVYSVEELWWCIFFCMIPFMGILLSRQHILTFVAGYAMGYYATGFAFLYCLNGILPLPRYTFYALMTVGILFFSLILGSVMWLIFLVYEKCHRHGRADIFLVAGCYILAEWLQGKLPLFAFPWFRLSTVLAERPFFIQGASLLGVLFVDFLIVLWNGMLAELIIKRKAAWASWTALALIVAVCLYSEWRLYEPEKVESCHIMLVQGGHEGRSKWGMAHQDILTDYTQTMTENIEDETDLIVLPETALPYAIIEDEETKTVLAELCRKSDTEILAGGIEKGVEGESYNAVYQVTAEGFQLPSYRKQVLVPFGEYLPFSAMMERAFPWLGEFMTGNVFEPGQEMRIFDTRVGDIGVLICFESVFSRMAAKAVQEGAELLVIVSNDAWFEGTPAMRQHHAHAILRAVETDRYVLRAANTGISSVIDNRGRVRSVMPENIRGVVKGEAVCRTADTIYSRLGDVLPVLFLIFLMTEAGKYCIAREKRSTRMRTDANGK